MFLPHTVQLSGFIHVFTTSLTRQRGKTSAEPSDTYSPPLNTRSECFFRKNRSNFFSIYDVIKYNVVQPIRAVCLLKIQSLKYFLSPASVFLLEKIHMSRVGLDLLERGSVWRVVILLIDVDVWMTSKEILFNFDWIDGRFKWGQNQTELQLL